MVNDGDMYDASPFVGQDLGSIPLRVSSRNREHEDRKQGSGEHGSGPVRCDTGMATHLISLIGWTNTPVFDSIKYRRIRS